MSLFIIESTGELNECNDKEKALQSSNVLIVISHDQKKVFTWIGSQASPHSKFACARESSRVRMELGYRIANLEEAHTTDEFLKAIDEVTGSSVGVSIKPKPQPRPTPTTQPKAQLKAHSRTKETMGSKSESLKTQKSKLLIDEIDLDELFTKLGTLPPIEDKIRDYVLIANTLYISPDAVEGEDYEIMKSLPDGAFVAEDYIPRLYVEDGKILAVELWRN